MIEYWFVFDTRKDFLSYEASFADEGAARSWAKLTLGEHAMVTQDFRNALVRPKALSGNGRRK